MSACRRPASPTRRGRAGALRLARAVSRVTQPGPAWAVVAVSAVLLAAGLYIARDLKIGDLDPGASELRPNSRYNLDNAYLTKNYSTSTDVFVTMVATRPQECGIYPTTVLIDRFQATLENVPGVESTRSVADDQKRLIGAVNEANPKWGCAQPRPLHDQPGHGGCAAGSLHLDCSMAPVLAFLTDHKAETLTGVVQAARRSRRNTTAPGRSSCWPAATPASTRPPTSSSSRPSAWCCSWSSAWWRCWCCGSSLVEGHPGDHGAAVHHDRAVRGDHGQARLGVKVATLPVIALGVGIGVDYGIYVYNKLKDYLAAGPAARRGVLQHPAHHRHRGGLHRADAGHGRLHLGVLGHQVPGRHGAAADVPVPLEHDRRDRCATAILAVLGKGRTTAA